MSTLDQLVKGAPPGNLFTIPPIASTESPNAPSLPDPLASLPSAPPQIYLNLLILEGSLRAQWLQLRTRRRQYAFFLTLLGLWIIFFGYALFFAPREDGSGVGGSVYWVVEMTEKVCFMGGIVTGILVWGTGQWERGIRWPRRWVGTTNRGLRGFNCKLVVIKQPCSSGSSYRYVDQSLLVESEKLSQSGGHHALPNIHENDESAGYDQDLAPGGDYIKLLLLPKPFSPTFRENWDMYRSEYWEKENELRSVLRKKLKERERQIARQQGGWLWWTGYRGWERGKGHDIEKTNHNLHRHSSVEKEPKRSRSGSVRSGSHSRNSSRSTTPTAELEEGHIGGHVRRGSTASNSSDRRRRKTTSGSRVQKLTPAGSRSATPEVHSPLVRENSLNRISPVDTESSATLVTGDGDSVQSLLLSAKRGSPARKHGSIRGAKQT